MNLQPFRAIKNTGGTETTRARQREDRPKPNTNKRIGTRNASARQQQGCCKPEYGAPKQRHVLVGHLDLRWMDERGLIRLASCVGYLGVREGLCDLAVSDAQYGYAAYVFIFTDTERVLPAIDRAIFGDPYVFDFKGAPSIEHHGLPECDVGVVSFVSRAGRRWLHGLHYTIVGHEIDERGGISL